MATHSNILTWKIPWTEEPGRLQSIALQRVGHDLATEQAIFCPVELCAGLLHHALILKVTSMCSKPCNMA